MITQNLTHLSGTELIDLINSKKISISDLIESTINQIKKINSDTNAFVHLDASGVLETAKILDNKLKK